MFKVGDKVKFMWEGHELHGTVAACSIKGIRENLYDINAVDVPFYQGNMKECLFGNVPEGRIEYEDINC